MEKILLTRAHSVNLLTKCDRLCIAITRNAFAHEPVKSQPRKLHFEILGQPPTVTVAI